MAESPVETAPLIPDDYTEIKCLLYDPFFPSLGSHSCGFLAAAIGRDFRMASIARAWVSTVGSPYHARTSDRLRPAANIDQGAGLKADQARHCLGQHISASIGCLGRAQP